MLLEKHIVHVFTYYIYLGGYFVCLFFTCFFWFPNSYVDNNITQYEVVKVKYNLNTVRGNRVPCMPWDIFVLRRYIRYILYLTIKAFSANLAGYPSHFGIPTTSTWYLTYIFYFLFLTEQIQRPQRYE